MVMPVYSAPPQPVSTLEDWQRRLRAYVGRNTQTEVARLIGVHRLTVRRWVDLDNPSMPRARHCIKLEVLMGIRRRRDS